MAAPRNNSIQRKLIRVILLTCSVVLFVAMGALFTIQLFSFRKNFTNDLSVLAEVMANNSTAALTAKDKMAAEALLAALQAKPHLVSASIRLPNGAEFARFGPPSRRDKLRTMPDEGFRFEDRYLLLGKPIMQGEENIGMLYLRADYQAVCEELLQLYLATLVGVLAVSLVLAYLLSARLQWVISEPILELATTARIIAQRKDYAVRARKRSNDEVGLFTDAFNEMLSRIQAKDADLQIARQELEGQVSALQHEIAERKRAEQKLAGLHQQLLETSRQAGMAEVATGVLHNVGNVLNSVNVSATLVRERLRNSRIPNLGKVTTLLREHESNLGDFITKDPKGQIIPPYLNQLSNHLEQENTDAQRLMESVTKNLEHIKEIVAMQQTHAKVAGVLETLSVAGLLEDALQINAAALERHRILVERDYAEVPPVTLDRHKVLQILVNLVRNAKYALDESGRDNKTLRLGLLCNGNNMLKITVTDNGIGIKPQNLTRIFSHGFTTKRDGHGFGLHSGAIVAKEMGGSLAAYSDGPGFGATFTLELPLEPANGKA